jgi:hypothetical protein
MQVLNPRICLLSMQHSLLIDSSLLVVLVSVGTVICSCCSDITSLDLVLLESMRSGGRFSFGLLGRVRINSGV